MEAAVETPQGEPINSPRSVTSDDDVAPHAMIGGACSAMISILPASQDVVAFCQSLRRRLLLGGVQCILPQTSDIGSTTWRRELISHVKKTSLFIPIVTADWLRSGVCVLSLYYALRRSLSKGSPTVVPILMTCALASGHPLCELLKKQTFHIVHSNNTAMIDELVVKLRNFIKLLQYDVPKHTVQDGDTLLDIYTYYHNFFLKKPPRKSLSTLVQGLSDNATSLCLENDLTRSPPVAYYVGDNGVKPLLEVVKMLPNLQTLSLRENGLTNSSMHLLVGALLLHPCITSLDLGGNEEISQLGAAELYYLVCSNQQIVEVKLDGTSVSSALWLSRIQKQLERNKLSVFGSWSQLRADNTEPFGISADFSDLTKDSVFWEVSLTCVPLDPLQCSSQWTCDNCSISATAVVTYQQNTQRYAEKMCGEDKAETLQYFRHVDKNTCSMKKLHGGAVKLVLETEGCGLEAIQQSLRQRAVKANGWDARLLSELQKVVVRAVCDKPMKCKLCSYFVDVELWYKGAKQIGKDVPQLFSEDIMRYVQCFVF